MARAAVDTLKIELDTMGAVCPFDYAVSGARTTVMHKFSVLRQHSGREVVIETEKESFQLYLYAFKSNELWEKHETAFREKLMGLKIQLESGVTDFTEAATKR